METLGQCILSVTAASILLAILQSLLGRKSSSGVLLKLIGGLFLMFTVISPLADIEIDSCFRVPSDLLAQGNAIAADGQEITKDQLQRIIKDRCEAYILDKAMSFGADLRVEVILTQDETPIPAAVRLQGAISPYAKASIQSWLTEDMGISKENQLWIG